MGMSWIFVCSVRQTHLRQPIGQRATQFSEGSMHLAALVCRSDSNVALACFPVPVAFPPLTLATNTATLKLYPVLPLATRESLAPALAMTDTPARCLTTETCLLAALVRPTRTLHLSFGSQLSSRPTTTPVALSLPTTGSHHANHLSGSQCLYPPNNSRFWIHMGVVPTVHNWLHCLFAASYLSRRPWLPGQPNPSGSDLRFSGRRTGTGGVLRFMIPCARTHNVPVALSFQGTLSSSFAPTLSAGTLCSLHKPGELRCRR